MRFVHKIVTSELSARERRELASLGVIVPATDGLVVFEIEESAKEWPLVKAWAKRRDAFDSTSTEFTEREIAEARWVQVRPSWHHGYPQPEDDYWHLTYDPGDCCRKCGIGLQQKEPFRMRREPKWGRRSLLQLNWIFDVYFATPDVWKSIFQPLGVASRVVTDTKGRVLTTVVQLIPGDQVDLIVTDFTAAVTETCAKCGRTKYHPVTRGPLPPLASEPRAALAWSNQYFGSGAPAHHSVVMSQELRRALAAAKVRGVSFEPVAG
jgi:hypothetical protein